MPTPFLVYHRRTALRLLGVSLSLLAVSVSAQGLLNPPGAPAPTMKSLQEISDQIGTIATAGRKPINSPNNAVTITLPGDYYLTGDTYALFIVVSDVTVDLNGHVLRPTSETTALHIGGSNVRVRNGRVSGLGTVTPGTNSWDLTFSGTNSIGVYTQGAVHDVRLEDIVVEGFFVGINAFSSGIPDNTVGLIAKNIVVRKCGQAVGTSSAVIEGMHVYSCSTTAVVANYSRIRDLRIERCGTGISAQKTTLSEVTVRHVANTGAGLSDCTVSGLNISSASSGLVGNGNSVSGLVSSENRGHGLSGSNNSIQNSVARSNVGRGFSGDTSTYQNITAIGNGADGINGTGLNIDGAIVASNTGHGVLAPESAVRDVSARFNTGAGVYADNSTISACVARSNGDDGIRGVGSVISDCRALGNDTNAGGYVAQGIVWSGGRIANSLADTATPAIP